MQKIEKVLIKDCKRQDKLRFKNSFTLKQAQENNSVINGFKEQKNLSNCNQGKSERFYKILE